MLNIDSDGLLRDANGNVYNDGKPLELNKWYRVELGIPVSAEYAAQLKRDRRRAWWGRVLTGWFPGEP